VQRAVPVIATPLAQHTKQESIGCRQIRCFLSGTAQHGELMFEYLIFRDSSFDSAGSERFCDEHQKMDQEQNGGLHVIYRKQAFGKYKARI